MGAGSTQTHGVRPVQEYDAPPDASHESESAMIRRVASRAAAEGARRAVAHVAGSDAARTFAETYPRVAAWLRMFAVSTAGVGIGAGGQSLIADHPPARIETPVVAPPQPTADAPCTPPLDPHLAQFLLHIGRVGEELRKQMQADGLDDYATSVAELTNIKNLPDDLQLCMLVALKVQESKQ